MDLQQLNNLIHIATKTELQTNLATWKAEIKSILELGRGEDEAYFINHTGRELFRKLYNFGLESEIKDNYDSGFRPISVKRFDPLSINTTAWYDASDETTITQVESSITGWLDKGPLKNNLTAKNKVGANAHDIEGKSLNDRDVLNINTNDYFEKEDVNLPTPSGDLQIFIVAKPTVVSHANDSMVSVNENTASEFTVDFQVDAGNVSQYRSRVQTTNASGANTNVNADTGVGPNTTNEWHIFSTIFDYSNGKTFHSYIDGAEVGASKSYTNKMAGGNLAPPTQLRLFANRGVSQFLEGSVAEVLFCENSSNDTREKIEGYLAHKWGLVSELDASHGYKDLIYKSFNP